MRTVIDGYNLLFFLDTKFKALSDARTYVIELVKKYFANSKNVCIVFDGKQEKGLGFSKIKSDNIEVIYTADGMSADEYILEWMHFSQLKTPTVVFTNDKGLKTQLKEYRFVQVHPLSRLKDKVKTEDEEIKNLTMSPAYHRYLKDAFEKDGK